jgi:hypothetical protein
VDDAAHQCGSMNPMSPSTLPVFPVLLLCGLAASFVYVAADLIAAATYPGYSFADQAVSELFAIGAPTSQMIVPLFSLSSALLLGFAAGIAASSAQNRALRLLALMFAGSAVVGLVLWNFFPMHMRGAERTFTDTMHLILATNPFVLITLVIAAVVWRTWFRWFSIAVLIIVMLLAMFAFRYATALDVGEPTPGLGLTERLAQYAYQVWQAALALLLLGGPKLRTPESVHL